MNCGWPAFLAAWWPLGALVCVALGAELMRRIQRPVYCKQCSEEVVIYRHSD